MPESTLPPVKFPAPRPSEPSLVLRRRSTSSPASPFEISEVSAVARESIKAIVSASRAPFGGGATNPPQVAELERSLRQLELKLAERERALRENETRLADHERDLAEIEALLVAREQLLSASRKTPAPQAAVSPEEKAALEQLRSELERQEAGLKEMKQALREREQFLDESETKLFAKVQAQQEKEMELEQREEDLRARERRLRESEAAADPLAAATLKSEDEASRQRDEFRE
jgi:DNA repair exonuclease SbcCD ATPase subunit